MSHPQKRNAYKVIEPDLNASVDPSLIASVTIGGVAIEMAEHVENNHVKKTGSLIRSKPITIKLMQDVTIRNTWFLTKLAYDQITGAFRADSECRFNMITQLLGLDRKTPTTEFEYVDCMISEDSFEDGENLATDNQMRSIIVNPTRRVENTL